ncbi:gem-associated protein 5-like [Vespula squamosa]|uniref:Gem-associated protein 5-like n=1 Tax=Vespula squamosa TaxID=30214 RepID=A0ABD1ZU68_VESSQ
MIPRKYLQKFFCNIEWFSMEFTFKWILLNLKLNNICIKCSLLHVDYFCIRQGMLKEKNMIPTSRNLCKSIYRCMWKSLKSKLIITGSADFTLHNNTITNDVNIENKDTAEIVIEILAYSDIKDIKVDIGKEIQKKTLEKRPFFFLYTQFSNILKSEKSFFRTSTEI